MSKFIELLNIDFSDRIEKKPNGKDKNGNDIFLSYLSWAYAWGEFVKHYPDATYIIHKNNNGMPYFNDDKVGAVVYTSVTANNITHEMWLPVLDSKNKSMKTETYQYNAWNYFKKSFETKNVESYTMFDVNKSLMRCLVKNLAMFGLGLYIFAGEDLPDLLTIDNNISINNKNIVNGIEYDTLKNKLIIIYDEKKDLVPEEYKEKLNTILSSNNKIDNINKIITYLENL